MKKIRYLPFGYTIRNGHTVVEQQEADIVRNIFKAYIQGASLKEIAEDLTAKQIPYTERTCVWDRRGFLGFWRMRSTPAMKNSRRSSTKTSTKKPSRSKAHGAGIRQSRKARASGRFATVSAAGNAVRRCSGTSIPNVRFGKAGHVAMQTAAFGCGSVTANCSGKSRSL